MLIDGEATLLDERSAAADQRRRQLRRWFGRLFGNPLSAIGLVLTALLIIVAIAAPLLAPQNPLSMVFTGSGIPTVCNSSAARFAASRGCNFRCADRASISWEPILSTGLSEVIGS